MTMAPRTNRTECIHPVLVGPVEKPLAIHREPMNPGAVFLKTAPNIMSALGVQAWFVCGGQ